MAKFYQIITDYFPSPQFQGQMDQSVKLLGNGVDRLPGMAIMKSNPANFQMLFDKFVAYIHNVGNGFAWQGSSGGGSGTPLLDGNQKQGECAMFARALSILAWAPKPYGLGLNKQSVEMVSYSGPYKKGFVSAHPVGGVLGLGPNVAGQGLYFWENHKVVKYQNRFFDPMYNQTYNNKIDMVQYGVMDNEASIDGATYYPTEPRATAGASGGAGSWFKEEPATFFAGPSTSMPF